MVSLASFKYAFRGLKEVISSERNAKIQWGITVCVYGLSHAPALLLLNFPNLPDRGAFLLFFLVMVAAAGQIGQELASRHLRRRPVARLIDRSFSA